MSLNNILAISTDVVLFSIRNERLEVLLVEREDRCWWLPGGGMAEDADLDTSALQQLERQTGVQGVYLEQLYTFGRPDRHPEQRLVSVAYYALVPDQQLHLRERRHERLRWFPVNHLPLLALDHATIVALAHKRLAAKLAYSTIALQFMPERFTLSALQSVYETILGATLDKRNFRKRVLAMGCLEATGELDRHGNHRPARLYRARTPGRVEFIK
jgi:8-oxo-dGTP diphosphatase